MKGHFAIALLALSPLTPTAVSASGTVGQVAVIAHASTNVGALSSEQLRAIFTRDLRHWSDGTRVVPLNLPARSPSRIVFDRAVFGREPQEMARFWIDRRIGGRGVPPREAPSAAAALLVVARLPGSVAYVPREIVTESVRVLAMVGKPSDTRKHDVSSSEQE